MRLRACLLLCAVSVPYLNRLFTTRTAVSQEVVVLLTPRVLMHDGR